MRSLTGFAVVMGEAYRLTRPKRTKLGRKQTELEVRIKLDFTLYLVVTVAH